MSYVLVLWEAKRARPKLPARVGLTPISFENHPNSICILFCIFHEKKLRRKTF